MSRSKYKNLIIVGNGFDCWQSIPTSYEKFRIFYRENIEAIATEMGCNFFEIENDSGIKKVTAVELIYGDPFNPDYLENEFFWNLESRMDQIDDQDINYYFGRSEDGLKKLNETVDEAINLLRNVFCKWVATFEIDNHSSGFCFPDDCFIINFNYTDTLEKRFGVKPSNIYHIHGEYKNPESIIVGHSSHPEKPFEELVKHDFIKPADPSKKLPRFDGLYAIEDALYKTDKHVQDRIDALCIAFMKSGVHIEDIENVYVLGHSLSPADMDYIEFLNSVTRCGCNYDRLSAVGHMDIELISAISMGDELASERLMGLIALNIQYATKHRNRIKPDADDYFVGLEDGRDDIMPYPEELATKVVKQRFWFEQAQRTNNVLEQLTLEYHVPVPDGCHSVLGYMDYVDYGHDQRKRNATWHISYHSDIDRKRFEKIAKNLRIKNLKLYPTIDECIAEFKM